MFPNIDQHPSTSEDRNYEDFEEDDDFTDVDNEEDPMDAYEDSIAVSNLVQEEETSQAGDDIENADQDNTMTYEAIIDEDSAMAYDQIEAEYNNIVGDVVSTLTYNNVMDDIIDVAYNEVEEHESAVPHKDGVEEEGSTSCNNIEEEIIYDDPYVDEEVEENSTIQTQILPEKLELKQALRDNEYCVVVVRHETDEAKPIEPSTEKQELLKEGVIDPGKKPPKKSSIKGRGMKKNKKWVPIKPDPLSKPKSVKTALATAQSVESTVVSEPMVMPSSEVQENHESQERNGEAILHEQGSPSEEQQVQKSPSKQLERAVVERQTSKERPVQKSPIKQAKMEFEEHETTEVPIVQNSPSERGTMVVEEQNTPSTTNRQVQQSQVIARSSKRAKMEVQEQEPLPTKKSPVKQKKEKISKGQEIDKLRQSPNAKCKKLNEIKMDCLFLDGEPIKLKECFVNIVKTPAKTITKTLRLQNTTKLTKKDESTTKTASSLTPPVCAEQDSGKDGKTVSESSGFLNALSLKSSQEDGNASADSTGLRRSARIRSGGGKRKALGVRSKWTVAFKESPKKKLKVEIDEGSQSSESVPYGLEDEDDPEVGVSDLGEDDDTTMSEAESDISSMSVKKSKTTFLPQTRNRRWVRYSAAAEGINRLKFHGSHRVRFGDQATQVGLPGSCEGFIFDVVRDDPRNVGISCNIFYHYVPKNWKPPTCSTVSSNVGFSSTSGFRSLKRRVSADRKRNTVTADEQQKAGPSKNTTKEHKLKYDKSMQKFVKSALSKNCSENISVSDRTINGENSDPTDDFSISTYPEDIVIKVEPAMDGFPGVENLGSGLADVASQKPDDVSSMAASAWAELDIKEEEEFHESEYAETARADQQSCIVTGLCEVNHDDSVNKTKTHAAQNAAGARNYQSGPGGVVHSSEPATDVDVMPQIEGPAEPSCSAETVRESVDVVCDVDEATDDNLHDNADSPKPSASKATLAICATGTLAELTSRIECPVQDKTSEMSAEPLAAPVGLYSEDGADALLESRNPNAIALPDSKCTNESLDLTGIHSSSSSSVGNEQKLRDAQNDAMVDLPITGESTSDADEISKSAESSESNVDKSPASNVPECSECAAELPVVAAPTESRAEAEMFCDSNDTENVEHSNSSGVHEELGLSGNLSHADSVERVGMSGDQTNTEDFKESIDSSSIFTHSIFESRDAADNSYSGTGHEDVERTNNPDASSDFSSDSESLIEVPIPDIPSEPDVTEPVVILVDDCAESANEKSSSTTSRDVTEETTPEKLHPASVFDIDESPVDAERAKESDLGEYSQELEGSCDAQVTDSSKKTVNRVQCGNPLEVFDSVVRNLEKMFEMDS